MSFIQRMIAETRRASSAWVDPVGNISEGFALTGWDAPLRLLRIPSEPDYITLLALPNSGGQIRFSLLAGVEYLATPESVKAGEPWERIRPRRPTRRRVTFIDQFAAGIAAELLPDIEIELRRDPRLANGRDAYQTLVRAGYSQLARWPVGLAEICWGLSVPLAPRPLARPEPDPEEIARCARDGFAGLGYGLHPDPPTVRLHVPSKLSPS